MNAIILFRWSSAVAHLVLRRCCSTALPRATVTTAATIGIAVILCRLQQLGQLLGVVVVVSQALDGRPVPRAADGHDHSRQRQREPGARRHLRSHRTHMSAHARRGCTMLGYMTEDVGDVCSLQAKMQGPCSVVREVSTSLRQTKQLRNSSYSLRRFGSTRMPPSHS